MAIIGLGNALTDILVQLPDESILRELGVERGGMYLIDSRKHQQMMTRIGHLPQSIAAGGSAANMVGGVATLGTPAAYVGHIGADATGEAFRRCQQQKHIKPLLGVSEATPSGKCISMVLPDGERTMLTYLGAALEIDTRELTPENLRGNKVLFIEGYLLNCPDVIEPAMQAAREAGVLVALDAASGAVLAVGAQAKAYLGRTPQKIRAVRPMKDGVIADFDVTREMIAYFVSKAIGRSRLFRPSMVISIPSGITQVEKKAVIDAALLAGAGEVRLVEEPMAAALGADLPVQEAVASMVLDIGGGTSEVAVISLSAMSVTRSLRIAGDVMNDAVRRYMRDVFGIVIGENSAERLKIELGTAVPVDDGRTAEVMGKDAVLGTPKTVSVSEAHVREALRDPLQAIAGAVLRALEMTPPELAADIYERGMLLAGGGGLLRGLDQYLAAAAHIPVRVDDDPLTTVLRGSARAMRDKRTYEDLFIN